MKARRVKGLTPSRPFAECLESALEVRAGEFARLAERGLAERDLALLHDARIAAKRLRYILELSGPLLGDEAAAGARRIRRIQDVLGELNDRVLLLPRVLDRIERARADDAAALREGAAAAPNRGLYRGLELLAARLTAERESLIDGFADLWAAIPDKRRPWAV